MSKKLKRLQKIINYRFRDEDLLVLALTHPSYSAEAGRTRLSSNQRLEFLGDAVLEIVISDYLYHEHPYIEEGELTRRRSSLVFEGALCKCARDIGLGEFLLLGIGEEQSGGSDKPSILEDAFEALTGAIYLDGGIKKARKFVLRYVVGVVDEMSLIDDKKSALQNYVQRRHGTSLRYATGASESLRKGAFRSVVYVGGASLGTGYGRSKKEAEQNAAAKACAKLGIG